MDEKEDGRRWSGRAAPALAVLVGTVAGLVGTIAAATPAARHSAVTVTANDSVPAAIETTLSATRPDGVSATAWRQVRSRYAAADFAPLFLEGGQPSVRARALVDAIAQADAQGLRRSDYVSPALADALESLAAGTAGATARARADVLLTSAFASYADDLLTGRVHPREVEAAWHIDPRAVDVDSALARTLNAARFDGALRQLEPQEEGYATLVQGLARYRRIAADGGWPTLGKGRVAHPGDTLPDAATLAERLRAEGFLPDGERSAAGRYAGALVAGVARFQARHGLVVDSIVGPRTRAALDVPAAQRARQIAANLDRFRWLPPDLGDRHIVVNVPAFRLDAFDNGERALTMRVVVGSELASRHTPIFADSMSYVQFGPYWNVPRSIARKEILPKARADREYLARNGYELVRGWGDDAPVVDPWNLSDAALGSSRYRIRQQPGPDNALGRVKFMFPNDFNVYLHDTPAQSLFDETTRAYSHGCVRVADPAALARFVLAGRADWTPDRIESTLRAGTRTRVPLDHKIPVYLIYLTAFDSAGTVAFREDLYDLDGPLMRALGDDAEAADTEALLARLRRLVGGGATTARATGTGA